MVAREQTVFLGNLQDLACRWWQRKTKRLCTWSLGAAALPTRHPIPTFGQPTLMLLLSDNMSRQTALWQGNLTFLASLTTPPHGKLRCFKVHRRIREYSIGNFCRFASPCFFYSLATTSVTTPRAHKRVVSKDASELGGLLVRPVFNHCSMSWAVFNTLWKVIAEIQKWL